jgi:hypothetical protein
MPFHTLKRINMDIHIRRERNALRFPPLGMGGDSERDIS